MKKTIPDPDKQPTKDVYYCDFCGEKDEWQSMTIEFNFGYGSTNDGMQGRINLCHKPECQGFGLKLYSICEVELKKFDTKDYFMESFDKINF